MKHVVTLCIGMAAWVYACVPASATVVTFDDLPAHVTNPPVPNGYASLNWSNFHYLDAADETHSGYYRGMVSADNVAFNAYGNPAEISGDPFNFIGAYFTGAWNDDLSITIRGYYLGSLVYADTIVVDADGPTWFQADYMSIDRVYFMSYGGVDHDPTDGITGIQFAMDNLTLGTGSALIPAPAGIILASFGAGLTGWLRRRRTI